METTDVAAVVTDIRRYWGSEYTDDELFAIALRQWRSPDNEAKDFVLQVVACRLEGQLLTWLLQPQVDDAAEDIQILFEVCSDPYFTTHGLELLGAMLNTLLTAVVIRAVGCDRSGESRKRRLAGILERIQGKVFVSSKARSILRVLEECETNEECAGAWMRFLELPSLLDPRVFNSRSGRAFMDEVEQVISLQQIELAAVRGSPAIVELEGEEEMSISSVLWRLAIEILEFIELKSDSSDNTEDTTCPEVNSALVIAESVSNLEEYLKVNASAVPLFVNGSSGYEISFNAEDVELSAVEQLSKTCFSSEEKSSISNYILEKAFDELSSLKDLDIISIQATFLLGMQMRLRGCFVDHCESIKDDFERRVRRVFNRLTDKAQDLDRAASLVVLAAFCPGQVIQQSIRGARTNVQHHNLYLKVLQASPLLLDWNEKTEDGTGTLFERELQQTLLEMSSNQSTFDRESQNVEAFLLSLVGSCGNPASKREASVMTVSKLLDRVINPVCCCPGQSVEMQLNLITLIQQLFQHFVNAGLDVDPSVLEASFNLVLAKLCSARASNLRLEVLVREKLLLLLKNIMEVMSDAASMTTLEQLGTPLNPSLWTLISLFISELGNDELCNGLADVATVEAFLLDKSVDDSPLTPVPLPTVISAVQVLLWGLLWDSVLSEKVSVESTKAETWTLLDTIAGFEFLMSNSNTEAIKGSLLIQSAVAEMMLECGSVLFQALLCNIIPYLLEYEQTELSQVDKLTIPKWAVYKLSEQPEIELELSCRLVSTHSILHYVAKCWCLSGAVNAQVATPSNELLLESLSHVLAAHDQASTSSRRSLSGTLFCIQWLCFLVSAACELQLELMAKWCTVRTQLELSLLRLLHQLEQLKGMSTAEALFSQYFVAAWLAYLPADQFEQVFNFIATKTNN